MADNTRGEALRPHGTAPAAAAALGRSARDRLVRSLSLADATMLVVSSTIGSGIFLTPGAVADLLPHPGLILAAWLAGGVLSLAGALANAELGAMYPHAGGDYVYLREAYHPVAGFLVGWLTFFVIYAGSIATLALAFAEGLASFVALGTAGKMAVAIGLTLATSWVNYVGVRPGAHLNNAIGYLKLAALVALAVAGPLLGHGSAANFQPLVTGAGAVAGSAFGLALSPVLFTYLGWNASIYVASEIHAPERNVPRSLLLGLAICTAVYLVVNAVYLYALPVASLRHEVNVGAAAARALFGPQAGTLLAIVVLISVLGTLSAMVLGGARIAYAMALDGLFFGGSERVHDVYGTPHRALVVQAAVVVALLVVLRSFPRVLDYTTFAIVLATVADVAAFYRLRRRRPDLPRPYRARGYPLVPALYVLANVAIAVVMLAGRPLECAIGLTITAAGLPVYWLLARARSHAGHGRRAANFF